MSKKIFVGGLPYAVTSEELHEAFAKFGEIESAEVLSDKFTGRSRGFGFVVMPNDEEAQRAIDELNGSQMSGRSITVNEAKPMERRERPAYGDRPRRDGNGGGTGGGNGGGYGGGARRY